LYQHYLKNLYTALITNANTATPTVTGFGQTDEIQECEFELVVSDGELTSLLDTVKIITVPDFGPNSFRQQNPPFDANKPTIIYFGGGDCTNGLAVDGWSPFTDAWLSRANIIYFPNGYTPDSGSTPHTYYKYGDMIIVYLSAVAPDYKQPIQTVGWSTGGQPAVDVGIHLNLDYADARYAINRVTFFDAIRYCRDHYSESISTFLGSSVDGEQCWADAYVSATSGGEGFVAGPPFQENVLNVGFPNATGTWYQRHILPSGWYPNSLVLAEMNDFNHGVVAGAYFCVIGPGKNLQLASTPGAQTYKFQWYGDASSGHMDYYDETNHPGRLPEPVTLIGPVDGSFVDASGAVFSCEVSENAVGYQLLFGPDPYRVMDYYIISDTPSPPTDVITMFPFETTWWTVKVRDEYGSTIYADPICINTEAPDPVENVTTGQTYDSIQEAIDAAGSGHEILVGRSMYCEKKINFKGKNLIVTSDDPYDPAVVAATVINGGTHSPAVTFSGGEDANCVLAGFTITNGNAGIYCCGASPTITNCTLSGNLASFGGGMHNTDNSSPTVTHCIFSRNSASLMGGGMYNDNSSPVVINCIFSGNSATYGGGGIGSASGGSVTLTNCIVWDNGPNQIFGGAAVSYSDVQGGFAGEGNIDADPLFADPTKGDYHLKSQAGRWNPESQTWVKDDVTSPCIDAGDSDCDWTAELWPHGKRMNVGAYGGTAEASMSLSDLGNATDCNNDGCVDTKDMLLLAEKWLIGNAPIAADIDRNGIVDLLDYARLAQDWLRQEP
jgi:hypothetical protein